MKRYAVPAIMVLLFAALAVWWMSPTQVVKRKVKSLLTTLTMEAGDGMVSRQTGGYSLNGLLADEVELETPTIKEANGTFQRTELESAYAWLSNQAKETRFELHDFQSVEIQGDKAVVKLTLTGLVVLPVYRPADGTYEVVFDWEKSKDGWRLRRAVWIQKP